MSHFISILALSIFLSKSHYVITINYLKHKLQHSNRSGCLEYKLNVCLRYGVNFKLIFIFFRSKRFVSKKFHVEFFFVAKRDCTKVHKKLVFISGVGEKKIVLHYCTICFVKFILFGE